MRKTVIFVIEDVLRKEAGGGLLQEGFELYKALSATARIVLLSDSDNEDEINQWMALNRINDYELLMFREVGDNTKSLRRANGVKNLQYDISFVVTGDPEDARDLLLEGHNVLYAGWAAYARPEWRPDWDGSVKPWAALEEEATRQALLKAADTRLTEEPR